MMRMDGTTETRDRDDVADDATVEANTATWRAGAAAELTTDELRELAALLDGRRRHDIDESQHLAESLGVVLASRSDSTADDEHDPEGPTLSSEWSRLQGLRSQTSDDIAAVDAAFARMQAGTYGVCLRCSRPIGVDRLRARPTAELCIACALTVDG